MSLQSPYGEITHNVWNSLNIENRHTFRNFRQVSKFNADTSGTTTVGFFVSALMEVLMHSKFDTPTPEIWHAILTQARQKARDVYKQATTMISETTDSCELSAGANSPTCIVTTKSANESDESSPKTTKKEVADENFHSSFEKIPESKNIDKQVIEDSKTAECLQARIQQEDKKQKDEAVTTKNNSTENDKKKSLTMADMFSEHQQWQQKQNLHVPRRRKKNDVSKGPAPQDSVPKVQGYWARQMKATQEREDSPKVELEERKSPTMYSSVASKVVVPPKKTNEKSTSSSTSKSARQSNSGTYPSVENQILPISKPKATEEESKPVAKKAEVKKTSDKNTKTTQKRSVARQLQKSGQVEDDGGWETPSNPAPPKKVWMPEETTDRLFEETSEGRLLKTITDVVNNNDKSSQDKAQENAQENQAKENRRDAVSVKQKSKEKEASQADKAAMRITRLMKKRKKKKEAKADRRLQEYQNVDDFNEMLEQEAQATFKHARQKLARARRAGDAQGVIASLGSDRLETQDWFIKIRSERPASLENLFIWAETVVYNFDLSYKLFETATYLGRTLCLKTIAQMTERKNLEQAYENHEYKKIVEMVWSSMAGSEKVCLQQGKNSIANGKADFSSFESIFAFCTQTIAREKSENGEIWALAVQVFDAAGDPNLFPILDVLDLILYRLKTNERSFFCAPRTNINSLESIFLWILNEYPNIAKIKTYGAALAKTADAIINGLLDAGVDPGGFPRDNIDGVPCDNDPNSIFDLPVLQVSEVAGVVFPAYPQVYNIINGFLGKPHFDKIAQNPSVNLIYNAIVFLKEWREDVETFKKGYGDPNAERPPGPTIEDHLEKLQNVYKGMITLDSGCDLQQNLQAFEMYENMELFDVSGQTSPGLKDLVLLDDSYLPPAEIKHFAMSIASGLARRLNPDDPLNSAVADVYNNFQNVQDGTKATNEKKETNRVLQAALSCPENPQDLMKKQIEDVLQMNFEVIDLNMEENPAAKVADIFGLNQESKAKLTDCINNAEKAKPPAKSANSKKKKKKKKKASVSNENSPRTSPTNSSSPTSSIDAKPETSSQPKDIIPCASKTIGIKPPTPPPPLKKARVDTPPSTITSTNSANTTTTTTNNNNDDTAANSIPASSSSESSVPAVKKKKSGAAKKRAKRKNVSKDQTYVNIPKDIALKNENDLVQQALKAIEQKTMYQSVEKKLAVLKEDRTKTAMRKLVENKTKMENSTTALQDFVSAARELVSSVESCDVNDGEVVANQLKKFKEKRVAMQQVHPDVDMPLVNQLANILQKDEDISKEEDDVNNTMYPSVQDRLQAIHQSAKDINFTMYPSVQQKLQAVHEKVSKPSETLDQMSSEEDVIEVSNQVANTKEKSAKPKSFVDMIQDIENAMNSKNFLELLRIVKFGVENSSPAMLLPKPEHPTSLESIFVFVLQEFPKWRNPKHVVIMDMLLHILLQAGVDPNGFPRPKVVGDESVAKIMNGHFENPNHEMLLEQFDSIVTRLHTFGLHRSEVTTLCENSPNPNRTPKKINMYTGCCAIVKNWIGGVETIVEKHQNETPQLKIFYDKLQHLSRVYECQLPPHPGGLQIAFNEKKFFDFKLKQGEIRDPGVTNVYLTYLVLYRMFDFQNKFIKHLSVNLKSFFV